MSAKEGPQTAAERAFAAAMLEIYRRGGREAAYGLLGRMADAREREEVSREDLLRMADEALAALPTLN